MSTDTTTRVDSVLLRQYRVAYQTANELHRSRDTRGRFAWSEVQDDLARDVVIGLPIFADDPEGMERLLDKARLYRQIMKLRSARAARYRERRPDTGRAS